MSIEPVLPISALEHYKYCPRQCMLIHVDGLWVESEHTARGDLGHRRVDSGAHRVERGHLTLRGIPLWSESLGLTGRADAIEILPDGSITPVEYKIGVPHGSTAHVQLCAQALCLEEMTGTPVPQGALWFDSPRRRLPVLLGDDLRSLTVRVITETREWMNASALPPPVDDARCTECQLAELCQPWLCAHPNTVSSYLEELVRCDY